MEQRRLLITLVVSLLIIVAYDRFVLSRYRKPEPPKTESTRVPEAPRAPVETPPPPASELAAPRGESSAVVVDTDTLRVSITPVGARLAEVKLKAYRHTVAPDSEPLNLVHAGAVLPGTLQLAADKSDAALVYRPDRSELVLHGTDEGEVVFVATDPGGQSVEKRYRFRGDAYAFQLVANVPQESDRARIGLVLTALPADAANATPQVGVAFANRRLVQKTVADFEKAPVTVDGAGWAGFAAQYFLAAAIPSDGAVPAVFTSASGVPVARVDAPVIDRRALFTVYTGPKDRDVLARAGHDLERALDFGWFWFVAIPLLRALRMLDAVTGNYGIAIIVLTALVKIATAPLTQTTFRNMREMQKIQPQMLKLRERFKDDQTALQKEMMELYRRHHVNPFSGCLPMVLQIPIFIGLYNALSHAIELRHAAFFLWINDLSAPDRLMIGGIGVPVLTILMGGTMFLQQWLTPQQGDPTQQRMMMFMPVMFTFFMINFPAGLVLYWLVNNILTIAQQYWMMRTPG